MRQNLLYILLILLTACGANEIEPELDTKSPSRFDLAKDYMSFSERMEDGDTLILIAGLSICTSWHTERNIFTKQARQTLLTSENEGEFVESSELTLPKVEYGNCPIDSLSFEFLFQKLGEERMHPEGNSSARLTVVFKSDTIRFYTNGLMDAMRLVHHYTEIKHCIYPEVELYQPLVPPTEP